MFHNKKRESDRIWRKFTTFERQYEILKKRKQKTIHGHCNVYTAQQDNDLTKKLKKF